LFTAEATGMENGSTPGLAMTDGVSADFRARLAGDIAAGFSNRNGIQTLVLKLDSDNLGQVDVRMQAKADHLSVRLLAADRESEAALRGNIKELSEAIQKRTGRFQHVEVRVELKGGEDLGQESRDEDPDHSSGRNQQGEKSEDPEYRRDQENHNAAEVETGPADGAQEG
jgi:flagellar hook-length control protein FliK